MTLFTSSRVRAAILLAGSVSFLAWAQSKIPADLDPQSRARLPWLKKSEVDAKRQKLFEAGIDASVIDVVRNNRPLDGLNEKDATVIRFGRQLLRDRKVDSATFGIVIRSTTFYGIGFASGLISLATPSGSG